MRPRPVCKRLTFDDVFVFPGAGCIVDTIDQNICIGNDSIIKTIDKSEVSRADITVAGPLQEAYQSCASTYQRVNNIFSHQIPEYINRSLTRLSLLIIL